MSEINVTGLLKVKNEATGAEAVFGQGDFEFEVVNAEARSSGTETWYATTLYAEIEDDGTEPFEIECELYEYPEGIYNHHNFDIPDR